MKLTLTAGHVQQIRNKALDDYLVAQGFGLSLPRVMLEIQDSCGRVTDYYFEQDETPNVFGDNKEAEYLTMLSNEDGG